jgi:hypothetical protein
MYNNCFFVNILCINAYGLQVCNCGYSFDTVLILFFFF